MHKNAFPKEMFQVEEGNFVPTGTGIDAIKPGGVGDREVRNLAIDPENLARKSVDVRPKQVTFSATENS